MVKITKDDASEVLKMRGFKLVKQEQRRIVFDTPGIYEVVEGTDASQID